MNLKENFNTNFFNNNLKFSMDAFSKLIANLSEDHKNRLNWFYSMRGKISGWPKSDNFFLTSAPGTKGIYKPKGWKYALSIRQSLKSDYPDLRPEYDEKGIWKYRYFQESFDFEKNLYTNEALKNNLQDRIPLGVFIQIKKKPESRYEFLGCGLIKEKLDTGHFLLQGIE